MTTQESHPLRNVKLLLLDADGVLTRGEIIYSDDAAEIKIFNVRDGLGLRLLMAAGIGVGVVTGRRSRALSHRCANLGITHLYDAVSDKAALLERICREMRVSPAEAAFIADDLPDVALMSRVGTPIAVADAHELVKARALYQTRAKGGAGAVREACEAILKARGLWAQTLKQVFDLEI
ncbi:MAG: HAD hydrolase family protein [Desulfobacteraceae bacterium]|jgi:3-deoxy-D-manno-octulosonate 8-phosphate phosphatase (KDO 8-P phosphatase)